MHASDALTDGDVDGSVVRGLPNLHDRVYGENRGCACVRGFSLSVHEKGQSDHLLATI